MSLNNLVKKDNYFKTIALHHKLFNLVSESDKIWSERMKLRFIIKKGMGFHSDKKNNFLHKRKCKRLSMVI